MSVLIILAFLFIIVFNNYTTKKVDGFEDVEKEKAYVINLDSRPDRWSKMQDKFRDAPFQLERFSAIKHENGLTGCGLSHTTIIQMAKDKNLPSVLIMEDDCKPIKEFNNIWPKIKKWLDQNSSSWDIFIGGNSYYASTIPSFDISSSSIKPICVINSNIKLYYTKLLCLHFYYLNVSGYDKFLEWKNNKKEAIDVWPNIIKMKIVSSLPFIATQDEDFSNINNSTANYEDIFKTSENVIASIQNNSACV